MDKAPNWHAAGEPRSRPRPTIAPGRRSKTIRHDLAEVPRTRLIITSLFVLLAILLARFSWGYPSAARSRRRSRLGPA